MNCSFLDMNELIQKLRADDAWKPMMLENCAPMMLDDAWKQEKLKKTEIYFENEKRKSL